MWVGDSVGAGDGSIVGGRYTGGFVGVRVVFVIRKGVGLKVGAKLGPLVGDLLGDGVDGELVGRAVGELVGNAVGDGVGEVVGQAVGDFVGFVVGVVVGDSVVGLRVGSFVAANITSPSTKGSKSSLSLAIGAATGGREGPFPVGAGALGTPSTTSHLSVKPPSLLKLSRQGSAALASTEIAASRTNCNIVRAHTPRLA